MVLADTLSFTYRSEQLAAVPALIRTLTESADEQVCLYFEDYILRNDDSENKFIKTPVKAPVRISEQNSSLDLDITGSPLRADFDPNEVFDNSADDFGPITKKSQLPLYSGLEVRNAQTLLSRLNISLIDTSSKNFVLCNPREKSNVLYLGNCVKDGELTQVCKTTWEGPVTSKSMNGALEAFTKNHVAHGGTGRTSMQCRAQYLLAGDEQESYMLLESSWEQSKSFLESPPPDAVTKLKVCLIPGDERFACDQQNAEIEQLEGLISGLSGEGLVWAGREEDTSLEDEVLEVLEASRKLGPTTGIQAVESENILNLQTRQDVDITDMLWTVLSRSQSFAELTDSLDLLFNTVLNEEIRPFIYSGNKSGLAGILRNILRTGTLPDLSGSKPLTLLVEMGIEKLKRDSSHYLLSSDLASKEAIDPYLSGTSLQNSVDLIKRLHMVVELAFACQTYLSMSTTSLKLLVHSALLKFKELDTISKVHLDFPVQTSDVQPQLESGSPGFWQIRLESSGARSVAQLQVDKPSEIHSVVIKPLQREEEGEGEEEEDTEYFIIFHTEIDQVD